MGLREMVDGSCIADRCWARNEPGDAEATVRVMLDRRVGTSIALRDVWPPHR
jgi:hypothetical protein